MTPRRLMRVATAAAVLFASIGIASRAVAQPAPSAEALAAANELFSLVSKDVTGQLARAMMAQMWPVIARDLEGKVDAATLGQLRQEFERVEMETLAELMKDAAPIYARHFNVTELREIVAFYRTPTGEKMQRELPQVITEFLQGIMPRLPAIQTTMQERFGKILRDRGYVK